MNNPYKWQKRIGVCHIAGHNTTLCGKPMLGNNYADQKTTEIDCVECVELNNKQNDNSTIGQEAKR